MIKRLIRKIKEAKLRKKLMNATIMYNNTSDIRYLAEMDKLTYEIATIEL